MQDGKSHIIKGPRQSTLPRPFLHQKGMKKDE